VVEYLGGESAGRHDRDRERRYRSRTIWWCGKKRIGEFLFHAKRGHSVLGVMCTNSLADNFAIVPQVNCKDLGELLDAKQPNGDSNTFQEMTICLAGAFG